MRSHLTAGTVRWRQWQARAWQRRRRQGAAAGAAYLRRHPEGGRHLCLRWDGACACGTPALAHTAWTRAFLLGHMSAMSDEASPVGCVPEALPHGRQAMLARLDRSSPLTCLSCLLICLRGPSVCNPSTSVLSDWCPGEMCERWQFAGPRDCL